MLLGAEPCKIEMRKNNLHFAYSILIFNCSKIGIKIPAVRTLVLGV